MCPRQGMESCQKFLQAQRKGLIYILFTFQWVGFAGRFHNETRGKRVCGGFRSKYAHGQQERPWLCWVGNREDIEKSDDGGDSQRWVAYTRRGNGICQRIGFIRDSHAFRRYTGSSFNRKTLRRSRVFLALDHQKWQENRLQYQTTYHPLSLVYRQVLLHHPHLIVQHFHRRILYSESTSVEVQGNLSHEPAEIENPN